jgi:hypothetical protein
VLDKKRCGGGGESMESLPLTNNYGSAKVSAISNKTSEKYGQNGMGKKGETS